MNNDQPQKDYYKILGIPRTATTADISKAYRDLARQYHPDRNRSPDATQIFQEITEANGVLSDPVKKARYDISSALDDDDDDSEDEDFFHRFTRYMENTDNREHMHPGMSAFRGGLENRFANARRVPHGFTNEQQWRAHHEDFMHGGPAEGPGGMASLFGSHFHGQPSFGARPAFGGLAGRMSMGTGMGGRIPEGFFDRGLMGGFDGTPLGGLGGDPMGGLGGGLMGGLGGRPPPGFGGGLGPFGGQPSSIFGARSPPGFGLGMGRGGMGSLFGGPGRFDGRLEDFEEVDPRMQRDSRFRRRNPFGRPRGFGPPGFGFR